MAEFSFADITVRLNLEDEEFQKSVGTMGEKLQGVANRVANVGLVALTAMTGLAVNSAIQFETAFAGVQKTVNATEAEFEVLREGILQMAREVPLAQTAIAGVTEAAGQLGIRTENLLSFTRVMADLGVATNLSATEAATALARLANITQMPQEQFDRLGSTIVALGNNFATTESEIVDMALRLAAAGNTVGLTEAQIMGVAAALSSMGLQAEAGGTAFSRVMFDMQASVEEGGAKLETFATVAGITSEDFARRFRDDAAGAIVLFIEGLANLEARGMTTSGVLTDLELNEIRVRDAMLRAAGAGDLLRTSVELGTQAWGENNALTTEAEKRYATTAAQIQLAKNRINEAGIEIGGTLLPIVADMTEMLGGAATKFAELDQSTQLAILGLTTLSLVGLKVVANLTAIKEGLTLARTAVAGFELSIAGTTVGLGAAAVALGVGAVAVHTLAYEFGLLEEETNNVNMTLMEFTQSQMPQATNKIDDATIAVNQFAGGLRGAFNIDLPKGTIALQAHTNAMEGLENSVTMTTLDYMELTPEMRKFELKANDATEATESLTAETDKLSTAERTLQDAVEGSAASLDMQRGVTREKNETTADFIMRLREAGFTEEELAAFVTETTEELTRQADGTVLVTDKVTGLTTAWKVQGDALIDVTAEYEKGTLAGDARVASLGREKSAVEGLATALDVWAAAQARVANRTPLDALRSESNPNEFQLLEFITANAEKTFSVLGLQGGTWDVFDDFGNAWRGLTTTQAAGVVGTDASTFSAVMEQQLANLLQFGSIHGPTTGNNTGGGTSGGGGGGSSTPTAFTPRTIANLQGYRMDGSEYTATIEQKTAQGHIGLSGGSLGSTAAMAPSALASYISSQVGGSWADEVRAWVGNAGLPYFAQGGIVDDLTLAVLGDNPSRKEAIVPLERAEEFGFGGTRESAGPQIVIENLYVMDGRDFDRTLAGWGVKRRLS